MTTLIGTAAMVAGLILGGVQSGVLTTEQAESIEREVAIVEGKIESLGAKYDIMLSADIATNNELKVLLQETDTKIVSVGNADVDNKINKFLKDTDSHYSRLDTMLDNAF